MHTDLLAAEELMNVELTLQSPITENRMMETDRNAMSNDTYMF